MKRKEFIQHLRSNGCEMIREGAAVIHGGATHSSVKGQQFQDIQKLMTFWQ